MVTNNKEETSEKRPKEHRKASLTESNRAIGGHAMTAQPTLVNSHAATSTSEENWPDFIDCSF